MSTTKTFRKKQIQEPTYIVTWVSPCGKSSKFKSTKSMLKSHEMLMKNNPFVKSFSISAIQDIKE